MTKKLGPIVSAIIVMFKEVFTYLIICVFTVISFSCVGFTTFQDNDELRSLEGSLLFFIKASFGAFDLTSFEDAYLPDRPNMYRLGVYYVLAFVFINLIILVNVVIAMMADTYGYMS